MITGSEEESRALMMNAAIRIVARYGFEGFTTKKWAAEAGVAEGSLYYHFKSKNDLLTETFFMIDREVAALYSPEDTVPGEREKLYAYIEDLWGRYYGFLLANPEKALYYYRFRTSPRFTGELQAVEHSLYNGFLSLLEILSNQLNLRTRFSHEIIWYYILDTATALAFRVITGGIRHTEESQKQVVRLMIKGLAGVIDK